MISKTIGAVFLLTFAVKDNGGVSGEDRIACVRDSDCQSDSLVCCRNGICCSTQYYHRYKTKCFDHGDCNGTMDYFTNSVKNEFCCNTMECCSVYSFRNQTEKVNTDGHFKFRVIVIGTIAATIILIATVVTFWCSSDKNRQRRRSFTRGGTYFSSAMETSREEQCGDVTLSCPGIDHDMFHQNLSTVLDVMIDKNAPEKQCKLKASVDLDGAESIPARNNDRHEDLNSSPLCMTQD